jgi:oligopeptide/dipeptide ABC transporter ATP-binding protein
MIEAVDIVKTFPARSGGLFGGEPVKALRGVSIEVPEGGAVALIGESGCGKTTLGRVLCGLETFDSGDLVFDGVSLSRLSARERNAHLRKVQLIHQDPYAALNPVRTIGAALTDALKLRARQAGKDGNWVRTRARELIRLVGMDPEEILYKYPHNLSGGQRQRVVIARALTVEPSVLVADEAVTMIDVSLRLGILQLLDDLRRRLGIGIVFITHDVAAARYVARDGRMVVIYRGEVFESGPVDEVIHAPVNPYTQSLLSAVPVLVGLEEPGPDRFIPRATMEADIAEGVCLFSGRCPFATDKCRTGHPDLLPIGGPERFNRCYYPQARRVTAVPHEVSGLRSQVSGLRPEH